MKSQPLGGAIFRRAPDAMLLADDRGRGLDANVAACALFQLDREQLIGRCVFCLAGHAHEHNGDRESRPLQDGAPLRGTYPFVRADGARLTLDCTVVPDVEPGVHLSVLRDVTEQHTAQEALRRSEACFRAVIAKTSEFISLTAADGTTTYLTPTAWEHLGWTPQELGPAGLRQLVVPEDRVRLEAALEHMVRTGAHELAFEFRVQRRDGSIAWIESTGTNLLGDPDVAAIVGNYRDITDRRRTLEALERSEERYRRIVEGTAEGVIVYDPRGVTTFLNARMADMLGYPLEETLGQSMLTFLTPSDREEGVARMARRKQGITERGDVRFQRKDGSEFWGAVQANGLFGEAGQFEAGLILVTDVSVQRRAEETRAQLAEQLVHAQKMEAVGRLAGGVAHDFNNLMSVVISYADLAVEALAPGDPLRADLQEIQRAGRRATELTGQLLAFSRKQVLHPRVLDLDRSIASMARMVSRVLGEDIELISRSRGDLHLVLADPGRIEQVVMNLAVNARDAMPGGGKLVIETANVVLDASTVVASGESVAAGDYVMLSMSDTGVGMDAATRARIFEPFFTTKEPGKGTGLGLATVFGIVRQSGGHLRVESEPGQGATFEIYLPRTDQSADAREQDLPTVALRGSETILLVEDEAQVRDAASAVLRRGGYHVLDASSGSEALRQSKAFPSRIHLLLTDVVMPRMSGRELAHGIARERPDIQVLFASGHADDTLVHHGVLEAGVAFLSKPLIPDELLRKVRQVLDDCKLSTPPP